MKRVPSLKSNLNVQELLIDVGSYHTQPTNSWFDGHAYEFQCKEVELIERCVQELIQMSLSLLDSEITQGNYQGYEFSENQKDLIQQSWEQNPLLCSACFEFHIEKDELQLLNITTAFNPFLMESSLLQWKWLDGLVQQNGKEQFNWIHEALINYVTHLKNSRDMNTVYLPFSLGNQLNYLKDVIEIVGCKVVLTHSTNSLEPTWNKILTNKHFLTKLLQNASCPTYISDRQQDKPVVNVWVIGDSVCGISVTESIDVSQHSHCVVPHYFIE